MESVVYIADVSCLAGDGLLRKAYDLLPPDRRARADRCRGQNRLLSVGASLLLRHALAGKTVPEPEFFYGDRGKPYIKNGPQFSLSHSGKYAACLLSPFEAGCDIQKLEGGRWALARRFFCPEEYADIASQPGEKAQTERFFRYWTQKESFIKATGAGLSLPLDSFRVHPDGGGPERYTFAVFSGIEEYLCAACIQGTGKILFEQKDLRKIL